LVGAAYWVCCTYGEHIAIADGLGHDGQAYADFATRGLRVVANRELDSYRIQRVVPSLAVWLAHRAARSTPTTESIVSAFMLMNVALVAAAVWCWTRVARRLRLSGSGRAYGAALLFGCFGVAKFTSYIPVLTDVWALALGFVFLVCYLERRPLLLALATLVGTFCWPSATHVGVVLLFGLGFREPEAAAVRPAPLRLDLAAAAVCALGYAWFARWLSWTPYEPGNGVPKLEDTTLRLGIVLGAAFVAVAVARLANHATLWSPTRWLRAVLSVHALMAAGVWLLARFAARRWASGGIIYDERDFLDCTVYTSLVRPGVFALAHALFFGPLVLCLYLRWRSIARRVHESGIGLTLVAALAIPFALNSESRRLFLLAPLLLPFVVAELDEIDLDRRAWVSLLALGLAGSKLWIRVHPDLETQLLAWPSQSYFMTMGPWMSWGSFLWQGAIAVASLVWLRSLLRPHSSRISASPPPLPAQLSTWMRTRSTGPSTPSGIDLQPGAGTNSPNEPSIVRADCPPTNTSTR
jgi:hypothetical protein